MPLRVTGAEVLGDEEHTEGGVDQALPKGSQPSVVATITRGRNSLVDTWMWKKKRHDLSRDASLVPASGLEEDEHKELTV